METVSLTAIADVLEPIQPSQGCPYIQKIGLRTKHNFLPGRLCGGREISENAHSNRRALQCQGEAGMSSKDSENFLPKQIYCREIAPFFGGEDLSENDEMF
jgi:hypothetical protein